jgi:hypothetical protein
LWSSIPSAQWYREPRIYWVQTLKLVPHSSPTATRGSQDFSACDCITVPITSRMKARDLTIIGCWLGGPNPSVMKPTAIVPLSFRRAVDLEHRATNDARRKNCRMRKKQSIFTISFDRDKAPKKRPEKHCTHGTLQARGSANLR